MPSHVETAVAKGLVTQCESRPTERTSSRSPVTSGVNDRHNPEQPRLLSANRWSPAPPAGHELRPGAAGWLPLVPARSNPRLDYRTDVLNSGSMGTTRWSPRRSRRRPHASSRSSADPLFWSALSRVPLNEGLVRSWCQQLGDLASAEFRICDLPVRPALADLRWDGGIDRAPSPGVCSAIA